METIEIHKKIAKIVIAFRSTYETPPRSRSIDDRTRIVRAIVGGYSRAANANYTRSNRSGASQFMSKHPKSQIIEIEERLRQAMLKSDVAELDALIAPELIFTSYHCWSCGAGCNLVH